MENQKVRSSSLRLSAVATSTRQTPKTDFGSVMRTGLMKAGNVVVDGLQVAAPFVPGGAIVSAALAGANSAAGMAGPSYAASSGGIASSSSALTSGGGSLAGGGSAGVGNYGSNGALAIPGARPGLSTDLSSSPSSFAGGSSGATAAGGGAAGASDSFNTMMSATRQMSEFQASFNLQYLQLQEKIQTDTRQFNLISNIMKTKHDAAKNALNNVR